MRVIRAGAALALSAALVSGCATTGAGGADGRSELDRAQARCVAAVAVGAVLGAVIGNNLGDGNAGRGALLGAGAGGVACAIISEAARERDRVLAYQRAAAERGEGGREQWVSATGRRMVMTVQVEGDEATAAESAATNADTSPADQLVCRFSTSSVQVEGMGSTSIGRQRWCRNADGSWTAA